MYHHSTLNSYNEPNITSLDQQDLFPTHEAFENIMMDYLSSLSPKKRDKALIDHARYRLIQTILKQPRDTSVSNAQFRFWVKKMFELQSYRTFELVCHDNKPVAIREQIYFILVQAHREAHHGGRDKTSAIVKSQFSWIPKELVARFVKNCPTCIDRRISNSTYRDYSSAMFLSPLLPTQHNLASDLALSSFSTSYPANYVACSTQPSYYTLLTEQQKDDLDF
ncbi:hypothetical protein EDC96DRAFT_452914 [Choanephora cucurbitarum]|nr:hypothetical protein EDC96DRAFT_452914 [Choanephora cucurbitarum]